MAAGQTYSQNQFGEAQIDSVLPIGGASPSLFPIYVSANGQKFFTGAGVPAFSSFAGDIFIRQDGASPNALIYVNTGTTNWTAATLGGTSMLLTGLGAGSNTAILAGDTLLAALAKLQAQITAL